MIVALLLGQPKGGSAYRERDLDLVAEAADRLAEWICPVLIAEKDSSSQSLADVPKVGTTGYAADQTSMIFF